MGARSRRRTTADAGISVARLAPRGPEVQEDHFAPGSAAGPSVARVVEVRAARAGLVFQRPSAAAGSGRPPAPRSRGRDGDGGDGRADAARGRAGPTRRRRAARAAPVNRSHVSAAVTNRRRNTGACDAGAVLRRRPGGGFCPPSRGQRGPSRRGRPPRARRRADAAAVPRSRRLAPRGRRCPHRLRCAVTSRQAHALLAGSGLLNGVSRRALVRGGCSRRRRARARVAGRPRSRYPEPRPPTCSRSSGARTGAAPPREASRGPLDGDGLALFETSTRARGADAGRWRSRAGRGALTRGALPRGSAGLATALAAEPARRTSAASGPGRHG
jgi:hypothetical protein